MARYNPDFWEVQTSTQFLESIPAERSPWFETEEDREHRYAQQDFFAAVLPIVEEWVRQRLTKRQQQIIRLYFFEGKTQEEIAAELNLTQSTVSRHIFGTVRNGKKVGGALPKLRKVLDSACHPAVDEALNQLWTRFAQSSRAA